MAQINLLKQSAGSGNYWSIASKFWFRLLGAVFILILLYYAWLFWSVKQSEASQAKITADIAEVSGVGGRDELLTRQLQLKTLDGIIVSHPYWSQMFPPLAAATLKNATYSSLSTASDGTLSLSATVPTLEDMDKYLQVFDIPDFNKNFSNVRISGFHKTQTKNTTSINFQIKMDFSPSLIQFRNASTTP